MIRGLLQKLAGSVWVALLAAAIIVTAQVAAKPPRPIYADEYEYLTVSMNVVRHGVFSHTIVSDTAPKPSAFFSPIAPLLYSFLLKADPTLMETISCQLANQADPRAHCRIAYSAFTRGVMIAIGIVGLFGSWPLARSLGMGTAGAWTVMLIVAASGTHAYYARHFLTEAPLLAIFPYFLMLLARATEPGANYRGVLLGLGVAMGLLAMSRPSYVYQAYAVLLALPLMRHWRGTASVGPAGFGASGWAALGYAAVILPWILRNLVTLGEFALTTGYDSFILVQRMVYNHMTWSEWAMAWIYWLPDFGDSLGEKLFGLEAVRKLSLVEPTGYHGLQGPPRPQVPVAPDGTASLPGLLSLLLADLPKHLMVSLALAWQGLWAGKYITFVAVLLAPLSLRIMARTGQLGAFLVILAPVLFMVGFNAFVSVSLPRYNLPMLWISAMIAAALVEAGLRRVRIAASVSLKDRSS